MRARKRNWFSCDQSGDKNYDALKESQHHTTLRLSDDVKGKRYVEIVVSVWNTDIDNDRLTEEVQFENEKNDKSIMAVVYQLDER